MSESGVIPPPEERARAAARAAEPYAWTVEIVPDMDGTGMVIGVDHDAVTIGAPDVLWRFSEAEAEDVARAWVTACWEAGRNAERMAREATMPP